MTDTEIKPKLQSLLKKLGIPLAIIGFLLMGFKFLFPEQIPEIVTEMLDTVEDEIEKNVPSSNTDEKLSDFYPLSTTENIVQHTHYTLSYAEKYEQAEWVAYELKAEQFASITVPRSNNFRLDKELETGSAHPNDYKKSNYDRGHLVPAADMNFSKIAMSESFLMSNICPQEKAFNRGIWKELEMQVRDWAIACKHLYVITGPVLSQRAKERIGYKKRLAVPRSFYKVLLDYTQPEIKGVAFVIPNERSDKPLDEYMTSINDVEMLTGIDFFSQLPDDIEDEIESQINPARWLYDNERFNMRTSIWNKGAE